MSLISKLRRFIFFKVTGDLKKARMELFFKLMKPVAGTRILDIGAGGGDLWTKFSESRNLNITGLDIKQGDSAAFKEFVVGDARDLSRFADKTFDVVFSNSCLEHVGDFTQQKRMADEIARTGKRYFIQVPNKHFPIEPHYFLPFLQYLPLKARRFVIKLFFGETEDIFLPTKRDLIRLFPGAKIISEKYMGLSKSFYVVRD